MITVGIAMEIYFLVLKLSLSSKQINQWRVLVRKGIVV
jgi:hypothetical protein